MLSSTTRRGHLLGVLALLACHGCSDSHPDRVPVSGKVLIDGQPLEQGFIQIVPRQARAASSKIEADGSFRLTTYEPGDGCVVGQHRVAIIANESQGPDAMKWYAPKRYADPQRSGLTLNVRAPRDDVEIHLTWNGRQPYIERFGNEGTQPPPE